MQRGRSAASFAILHWILAMWFQVLRDPAGLDEALGDAVRVAQRVWTSDQRFCPQNVNSSSEFCSLLNAALREDDPDLLTAVICTEFCSICL